VSALQIAEKIEQESSLEGIEKEELIIENCLAALCSSASYVVSFQNHEGAGDATAWESRYSRKLIAVPVAALNSDGNRDSNSSC
jgi:hypothetical protein